MISRLRYYLTLIPVSFRSIKNRAEMLALLFRRPSQTPVLLRFRDGTQFLVRTALDVWIILETYLGHTYEQNGFDIQKNWRILDIGAGLGDFAITAAKKCPEGMVCAYEPFEESFALMEQNISLNGLENIRPYPYAVHATAREMPFKTSSGVPVLHTTTVSGDPEEKHDSTVWATTLDEIFDGCEIETCDLIKMDCEGAEFDILLHASPRPFVRTKRITLEYHNGITQYSHLDLIALLKQNGFSVICQPSPVHNHTGLLFASK